MTRSFRQVDVFTTEAYRGNPVAVVMDGASLDDETMQRVANWMNLSETTFVLPPTTGDADYRVRIFTPSRELPFAGHPTLGTCHAWLEGGGVPRSEGVVIQECAAGLIQVRRGAEELAFAAPALVRSGPVDEELVERIADMLGVSRGEILDSQWVDNGPGWVGVMLRDAQAVLALTPGSVDLFLGVVGAYPVGSGASVRGSSVLSGLRGLRRGSRHREPERVTGRMAAEHRESTSPVRRQPGHRDWPTRTSQHLLRRRRHDLDRRRHGHVRHRAGRAVGRRAQPYNASKRSEYFS